MKYDSLIHLQVLFPVVLFIVSYLVSSFCRRWTFCTRGGASVIKFVADSTLEIYIVQALFIWRQYGGNPLISIVVTIVCSATLHWVVLNTFGKIRIRKSD